VLVGLILCIAPNADAQIERPWVIELYGGAFVPLSPSSWTDVVATSAGLGATVGYQLAPRIYILANGTWGLVTGATVNDEKQSNWDVFSYFLSGAYDFTEGKSVSLLGQLGVGGTSFKQDILDATSETKFAVNGGFKLYWNINPQIGLTLNTIVVVAFTENDPTVNLPVSAGVVFRF
jgi:hypothetical protein